MRRVLEGRWSVVLNETSFAFARAQPGQKKGFFDWLLEKSCRDSSEIGAGYEDDLKNGAFKPKGGLDISEGGSFKI